MDRADYAPSIRHVWVAFWCQFCRVSLMSFLPLNLTAAFCSRWYARCGQGSEAIEQTVRDNYKDNRLDTDAVWRDVTAQFGSKRAAFVLAMTVREKDYDGRFSRENKAWAKTQPLPPDPEHRGLYCSYVVDKAHPVLTDALVTHARRELERKPSVKEKLQSAETPTRSAAKAAVPEL